MAQFSASVAAVCRALLCLALALPLAQGTEQIIVQAAGASFPNLVYQDLIFAYQFVAPNVKMSYVSTGSGGGKCRIKVSSMPITLVLLASHATQYSSCRAHTHVVSRFACGARVLTYVALLQQDFAKTCNVAGDDARAENFIDWAGSDSLLNNEDYAAYPDLQMLPTVSSLSKHLPSLLNFV
jgi:hypothetical protein